MAASTDVEQASVVHIAVSRDEGKYEVAVFPQRKQLRRACESS